jgi:hypothetical protein
VVTVENSPYRLKATAGQNREKGLEERWTYFDILIDRIDLLWGGKALIPGGNRADIDPLYHNRTVADEQDINDQLAVQKRADETLDTAHQYAVELPCNQFTSWVYDMEDGNQNRRTTLWLNHRKQWGDGPRIPLVARIYIAKAAGGGIHGGETAKAIGLARFLWDWESEDEIAALGAAGHKPPVQAFLADALEYQRAAGDGPPGSTNCHADHGGKRGGGTTVFADLPSHSARSHGCPTRSWATWRTAHLTGPAAGCVGVLFQPSRIALDTYKITVWAPPDCGGGGYAALDTAGAASTLRNGHASLPRAESGTFQIWRRVRLRYARKSGAVTSAVLNTIGQEYRRAGVVLDWGTAMERTADETTLANNFDAWCTQALLNPDAKGRMAIETNRAFFEPNDQFGAGTGAGTRFGFIAQSWEKIVADTRLEAIREYVLNKNRTIDTPRKRYNAWINQGNLAANDRQFLLPFYQGLSQARKAKVDAIYNTKMAQKGLPATRETYLSNLEGAGVEVARLIAQQLLLHGNDHCMVILHCEAPIAFRMPDNSIFEPPSATGGLSPSTSSQWNGRGSIHLVFLPEVPSGDPAAKYHVAVTHVVTHEAGHNLYLCHAPAGKPPPAPSFRQYAHDKDDLLCLMNYDQASDHLCGYCNLKLRGYGTVAQGEDLTFNGPIEHGLVKLWHVRTRNRKP